MTVASAGMRSVSEVARAIAEAWWTAWRTPGDPERQFVARVEAIVSEETRLKTIDAPSEQTVRLIPRQDLAALRAEAARSGAARRGHRPGAG